MIELSDLSLIWASKWGISGRGKWLGRNGCDMSKALWVAGAYRWSGEGGRRQAQRRKQEDAHWQPSRSSYKVSTLLCNQGDPQEILSREWHHQIWNPETSLLVSSDGLEGRFPHHRPKWWKFLLLFKVPNLDEPIISRKEVKSMQIHSLGISPYNSLTFTY